MANSNGSGRSRIWHNIWPAIVFGSSVLLNLLILAGTSWLSNGYVSRTTYDAYVETQRNKREADAKELNEKLQKIALDLKEITDNAKNESMRDSKLQQLEKDMRDLERQKR